VSDPAIQVPLGGATHEAWSPDGLIAPTRVSEVAVLDALKTVFDPEIPVDIYELGLIYAVEVDDEGAVKIDMTLTTPSCPSAQELPGMVEEAVRTVPNVTSAKVEIVWDPPWDPSRMSEDAKLALNMY
jgi:FeS assembly SUF system protein